ncbi:MAG: N-6 DNA methylase [Ignavibacteria bacterium]|jgi:methylase of polypeptide subunit release factors|nr:N-6 DNA methylase [Ignavibacteria bacterium]
MGSLVKEYSKSKLKGQIYTPQLIVSKILDDVGYNSVEILGKNIIDPACGDGRFLVGIARRIINYSDEHNIENNLKCVYGWDIDVQAIEQCISNLNSLVKHIGITINWNISVTNALERIQTDIFSAEADKFDYIVGNPPYIRIQHLDSEQRNFIQHNYSFCKSGSTDIYIAFFELCHNLLADKGVCGLITPNTFFSTETARSLRQFFMNNRNILQITNYGDIQLFENATTYSAITIFNKQHNYNFLFQKADSVSTFKEKICSFTELTEPFWNLSVNTTEKIIGKKLKEICDIHVGITTLCDKAYIFQIETIDDDYVYAITELKGKIKIEKAILKPIVKGSKLKSSNQPIDKYILFPYKQINGKAVIISEDELEQTYPLAYSYLLSVKSILNKRDNGRPNAIAWYAFGRSQGLDTSFGEKIIFSPMNEKPNFVYYDNKDCTFYSGYCIKYKGDAKKLLQQLNSKRMEQFVAMSCRDFRGGWKAYNKKIIENFIVNMVDTINL